MTSVGGAINTKLIETEWDKTEWEW